MAGDASEQSLQDLIAEAKNISASLAKLSSVLGKTAEGGKAAPNMDTAAKAINEVGAGMSKVLPLMGPAGVAIKVLTVAVEAVGKVFSMLGNLITGLFSGLTNAAGILGEFAMTVSKGNMSVSDLVGVMGKLAEQVPIVGGALSALFGLFKIAVQRQEENLEVYRKISEVGGQLGGNLTQMRTFIRDTGMTLDEFAGAVQKHSQIFSLGAGSTDAGMKVFAKGMKELNNVNNEAGNTMRGLGLTADQMNDTMALYLLTQGNINKQGLQDSKKTAQGAAELAQEITYLSEVTGKRKEQIAGEIKEAAEEANWKNFLAGLSPEESAKASKAVNQALLEGGKDVANGVKMFMQTGISTPVTKATQSMEALTGGAYSKYVETVGGAAKDASISLKQQGAIQDRATNELGKSSQTMVENFRTVNAIQLTKGQALFPQELVGLANKTVAAGKDDLENRAKLKDANAKAGENEAAALVKQQQRLKNFGATIDDIISKLFAPFLGPVMNLVDKFMSGGENAIEKFKPLIDALTVAGTQLANWMDKIINRFANIKNVEQFWAEVKRTFNEIWVWMKPAIISLWENVKPVLIDGLSSLFGALFKALMNKITFGIFEGGASDKAAGGSVEGVSQTGEVDLSGGGSSEPAPADNSKLARDYAFKALTGQSTEGMPSEIKNDVEKMKSDPGLKDQVEKYKADIKSRDEAAKAQREKEAANSKKSSEQTSQAETAKPAATAPTATQESKGDPISVLNSNIERLIRSNQVVADNTKATTQAILSNADLFRRA